MGGVREALRSRTFFRFACLRPSVLNGTVFGPAAHFAPEDLEIGPDKTFDKTVAKTWF